VWPGLTPRTSVPGRIISSVSWRSEKLRHFSIDGNQFSRHISTRTFYSGAFSGLLEFQPTTARSGTNAYLWVFSLHDELATLPGGEKDPVQLAWIFSVAPRVPSHMPSSNSGDVDLDDSRMQGRPKKLVAEKKRKIWLGPLASIPKRQLHGRRFKFAPSRLFCCEVVEIRVDANKKTRSTNWVAAMSAAK